MPHEDYQDRHGASGSATYDDVLHKRAQESDSGLARQSSRQVGLIELGAATVIHNVRTQGSRASERASE